jgi:predicted NAD/FAD-binding protein
VKALGCWDHESSRVVVHTDERLMPSRKEDWSPVNLIMEPGQTQSQLEVEQLKREEAQLVKESSNNLSDMVKVGGGRGPAGFKLSASMCSIWMCAVDNKLDKDLIQTWNPVIEPRKDTVVANAWFERPILNSSSSRGIAELGAAQGSGGLFFVGAYVAAAVFFSTRCLL